MKRSQVSESESSDKWEVQLRKGCLELAILAALWNGKRYGLEILQRVESHSDLVISEGTVYPLLTRIRALGLLRSEWVESSAGHPRKYYALTAAGRQRAAEMAEIWQRFSSSMDRLLTPITKRKRLMHEEAQRRIDSYLSRVRVRLGGLNKADIRDILEELHSHIVDKVAASGGLSPVDVDTTLEDLGSPEEVASQYMADNLGRRQVSASPLHLLWSLVPWASRSVANFLALFRLRHRIFLWGCFCAYRGPETETPTDRGIVGSPRPRRRAHNFPSTASGACQPAARTCSVGG